MPSKKHDAFFSRLRAKQASPIEDFRAKADVLASIRFDKQNDLANDPHRFIGVTCGRRSGKSTGCLTIAVEACVRNKDSQWVIIGLARPSIKRIYWRLLKKLNDDLNLGIDFKQVELLAIFPNGSVLSFLGAETTSEIEKLRGGAYHGVIVDECKSFNPIVLSELVEDVIRPALADHNGKLILIGTPGRDLRGIFYEATQQPSPLNVAGRPTNSRYGSGIEAEWSSHHWDARDNVAMPNIWKDFLATKKSKGWADDNPTWCREYLGLWVADHRSFVFRFNPERNTYSRDFDGDFGLPPGHDWILVMGIDPGHDDPTGISLWAYSTTHPDLFNLFSVKEAGLNVTGIANLIKSVDEIFGEPEVRVGDRTGLGKLIFKELADNHDIYIERADKREKNDAIELFNTDLDDGHVWIEKDSVLAEQLAGHRWTYRNGVKVESNTTENDVADSAVYAHRYCEHHRYRPTTVNHTLYSEAYYADLESKMIEDAVRRENNKSREVLDEDWF